MTPEVLRYRTNRRVARLGLALVLLLAISTSMLTRGVDASYREEPVIAQQLAVPSYIHPNASPEDWLRLSTSIPGSVGVAVANVINGPDYTPMPEWSSVIHATHANGVKVIGYVDTGYLGTTGQRTRIGSTSVVDWISQIQGDIATWYAFYGEDLSGIFFDQGQNACGPGETNAWADLYRRLHDEVHRLHPGAFTVLNPGIVVPQCYEHSADVLVTFEGSYASYSNDPSAALQYAPLGWDPVDPMKIWHIVYDASTNEQMAHAMALGKSRTAGYMYVTDDVMSNPYDKLPPEQYWLAEQQIATRPAPVEPPPAPPTFVDSVEHHGTAIDLDWVASDPRQTAVVAYDIFRDGVRVGSVPGDSTTYQAVNLAPLTTYTFTVVARDAAGRVSAPSAPLVETSDDTYGQDPEAPVNVTIAATSYTDSSITWDPGPPIEPKDRPAIESIVVFQNGRPILSLPGTATSVTVGKLAPGAKYDFALAAVDSSGRQSPRSATVTANIPELPEGRTIGQFTVTKGPKQFVYSAEFLVPFAFRRVFISTGDAARPCWATGSQPQMCADFVIENERLLRYNGSGTDWEWVVVRDVRPVVDGTSYTWAISPADIGGVTAATEMFNANGYAPNSNCGVDFACGSTGPPFPYE